MKRLGLLAAFGIFWAGCSGTPDDKKEDANASNTPGASSPEAMTVAYSSVQDIFNSKCIGCHGENGKEDIDLRSYETVMKGGEHGAIVKPGDPAGSKIVEVLKADPEHRMPKGMDALPAEQIKMIEDWIAAGAKES